MLTRLRHDDQGGELAILRTAERNLAKCHDLHAVVEVRNEAEAFRVYAKARKLSLEIQNRGARLKIQAERKLGAALKALKLRGGDRKSKSQLESLKLCDLGIDRNESFRWQTAASAPDELFESYCRKRQDNGLEISSANFLAYIRQTVSGNSTRARRGDHAASSKPRLRDLFPDDLDELQGHIETLAGLFEGICERLGKQLEPVERREIPRYFQRMRRLLQSAKQHA
ncbi:MAG: hypothetical protein KDB23_00275 [Planctomycetales bacterium]|nr:hypothetical protein [Planctomycetales bacterium]